jgi:hypothetical protein
MFRPLRLYGDEMGWAGFFWDRGDRVSMGVTFNESDAVLIYMIRDRQGMA